MTEDVANILPSELLDHFTTNVIGTLLITQAVSPLFHSGTKIVNISSMVGSFAATKSMPIPIVPSYSISKAALNMATVKQAFLYSDQVVVALDPGLIKTDMNPMGTNSAEDVGAKLLKTVENLKKEDSGSFVSWEGKPTAW